MMDNVREKLVGLLTGCGICFHCLPSGIHEEQEKCRIADHLIANGVTVQEWRPVSEPPEADEQLHFYDDGRMRCITVLAYTEYGRTIPKNRLLIRPTGNEYLDRQVTDGWVWDSGSENITHWMPMPTPPKGE